jgi:hypothetical protein
MKAALLAAVVQMDIVIASPLFTEQSWKSGETIVKLFVDGTLLVSGQGAMEDYHFTRNPAPWCRYRATEDGFAYPNIAVVVEEGVTYIGRSAFHSYDYLISVTISNSVTSIGDSAFYGCKGLTSVTIGDGVTAIGNSVFEKCSNLIAVTIPGGVTSIGDYVFHDCSEMIYAMIENGVKSIGNNMFLNCLNLRHVTIPNSVTTMGKYAFANCDLTSISIPKGVTEIDSGMFWGCINLTSVIVQNYKPPNVQPGAFHDIYWNAACLYVPARGLFAYRVADVWREFDCIKTIEFYKMGIPLLVLSILMALILSVTLFVLIKKSRKSSDVSVI